MNAEELASICGDAPCEVMTAENAKLRETCDRLELQKESQSREIGLLHKTTQFNESLLRNEITRLRELLAGYRDTHRMTGCIGTNRCGYCRDIDAAQGR